MAFEGQRPEYMECACVCTIYKNLSLANWRPTRMKSMSLKSPQPFTHLLRRHPRFKKTGVSKPFCGDAHASKKRGCWSLFAETLTFQKNGSVGAFCLTRRLGVVCCKMHTNLYYTGTSFFSCGVSREPFSHS